MSKEDGGYEIQMHTPELGKKSSPVRGILKDIKNLPRQEAERLLREAWKLVNLGVSYSKQWRAELYDQNAVFESNGGNLVEAERLALAGLAVLSHDLQSHNHTRARSLRNYSQIMIAGGDYESALMVAEHALAEHDLDIEKHKDDPEDYTKGLRHKKITQTYHDRALILADKDQGDLARDRLLDFLETHDSATLPSEVERVVDFVEVQRIDPSIRDSFPESKERNFTLNPIKLGGSAARSAFRLGNSSLKLARHFMPKL